MKIFGYEGKNVVVTGAASGMGKAAAELLVKAGARVYAMDISPIAVEGVAKKIRVDLSDKASIDQAFTELPEHIDAYFSIAGVMGAAFPFMKTLKINLISNKYVAEELLPQRMGEGGAVVIVASAIAVNWKAEGNIKYFKDIVTAEGWDGAVKAAESSGVDKTPPILGYPFSKKAVAYLGAHLQSVLAAKHIRVNIVCPGATRTAFGSESVSVRPTSDDDMMIFAGYSGRIADPTEVAWPMLFLNSPLASYVSGAVLFIDYGTTIEIEAGIKPSEFSATFEDIFQHMA